MSPAGARESRPSQRSQDLSIRYTERLAEAGIEASVGSKDDSYDNALAETVTIGHVPPAEFEAMYHADRKGQTKEVGLN